MNKKIFVIGTRGIPNIQGGVERHCLELYPRISKVIKNINICTRKNYVRDKSINCYMGVKLYHLWSFRNKNFEAISHTINGIFFCLFKNAHIVHIHTIGCAIVTPLARILGMKVVFTHHGFDYNRQKWNGFAKTILRFGEKLGITFANEIICISNEIYEFVLKERKSRSNVHLIYNGVTKPVQINTKSFITKIGVKKKYILSVGRLVEEKGFHDLIQAFINNTDSNYQLVIAGEADHESNYSKSLKKYSKNQHVIFSGYVSGNNLSELYSHASLFVLPSYHEGLPIALLEALSYGTPVLVSDIKPHIEVGLNSSRYFKVGNISELKRKLNDISIYSYSDSEKNYISDILTNKYNWDIISEQTIKIYKNIM